MGVKDKRIYLTKIELKLLIAMCGKANDAAARSSIDDPVNDVVADILRELECKLNKHQSSRNPSGGNNEEEDE